MKELVVTAEHGESWRCRAICRSGRRCTRVAVRSDRAPNPSLRIGLCVYHQAPLAGGAAVRFDDLAGLDTIAVAEGGPHDGDRIAVRARLTVGATCRIPFTGGSVHLYRLADDGRLRHDGACG